MQEKGSPQTFGEFLRQLRRQHGMELKDLSDASGISVARLMALESGWGTPNRRELRALGPAFHLSGEHILVQASRLRLILD